MYLCLGSMKVTADLQELLAASKFLDEELAKAKVHGQGQMILDLAVKNGKIMKNKEFTNE